METDFDNVLVCKVSCLGLPCTLVLKEDRIVCLREGEPIDDIPSNNVFNVDLEDVIGLRVERLPISSLLYTCKAELVSYEKTMSSLQTKPQRKLIKRQIYFNAKEDFGENYKTAAECRETIQQKRIERIKQVFVHTSEQVDRVPEPLRLLVFINPFSGKKKSEKLYRSVAFPLFETAGVIIVQEIITERIGHAQEFIKTFDLSKITGIVMASGDGILYEVINGLMERPDWESAIKTPMGILPTGSGNALVTSQLYETNEKGSDPLLSAVFQIINGGIQSHDIASVVTESSHTYMAVVLNWGITGIIDIESEKYRFLGGELRYLLGSLMCIAKKKSYHGRLSYLPIDDEDITERHKEETENVKVSILCEEANNVQEEIIETSQHKERTMNERLEEGEENVKHIAEDNNRIEIGDDVNVSSNNDSKVRPMSSVSISDEIPAHWKTIEGQFIVFVILMCSHITDSTPGHISMSTGSGKLMIVYTTDNVTRKQLLSAMSEPKDGDPNRINYHSIATRALRLTPLCPSIMSVDGERINFGPVQIQVHPGMMRLFSRKRNE